MPEEQLEHSERIKEFYRPRIIDLKISEKLSAFGGILITGPRSCGKSWTGAFHSRSSTYLGDEDTNRLASIDPYSALTGDRPHLVDEWQDVPKLWDIARRNIDLGHEKGMYIFTGSSVPPLERTSHTGIGRFARLQMRTMSLFESGVSTGIVSLSELFDTGIAGNAGSKMDYNGIVNLICRGGWPGALDIDDKTAMGMPYDYIESLIELDTARIDGKRRSSETMGLLIRSLARNNATSASIPTIAADIRGYGEAVTEQTVRNYIEVLEKLFVIEEQGAWHPQLRSRTRIRTSPVRHFCDPSLAAAALGAGRDVLLKDVRTTGQLFESLCYRDLSVYASALGGRVFHYRDDADLEIDAIIQLEDGRWGAVEVKLGTVDFEKAAANLIRMKNKMMAGGTAEPSFLMILNATGGIVHTRPDGVVEVPIDCLGP